MNETLALGSNIGVAQATITTLACALTVGIAFLVRPGCASLLWSIAFTLAMVATFGVVAAAANDAETIRRACLGALLGSPAFLWSGFRAFWGLRPFAGTGAVMAVVWAAALALSGDSGWFPDLYRAAFLTASVFAGLIAVDWLRTPRARTDRLMLPMGVTSLVFVAIALGAVIWALLPTDPGIEEFSVLRPVSSIGMLLYVTAAMIAVLGPVILDAGIVPTRRSSDAWQRFERTATARLRRAEGSAAPWSVVYFRLDDADDIRQTAGAAALANLSTRFADEVRAVFPAGAEVGSPSAGVAVAVVSRADSAVRDLVRTVLDRVPALDVHHSVPIRPTTSAGWASASALGHDYEALLYTAREAAILAAHNGGDRWERVGPAVMQRLLSEPSPR